MLVSHVHWDHLDLASLGQIERSTPVVVPSGAGVLLSRRGFRDVLEVEAGDAVGVRDVSLRATHAEHTATRGPFGVRAPSLGYLVEHPRKIYFAGDTDLFEGMSEFSGRLEVALLPISGWGPRVPPGLVHVPELVFLDEPTTGLDPQARANLWQHIRALREDRGTTVFLTTHYLDEADALCDRILVIDHGAIVASGTPDQLKSQVGGDVLTVTVARPDQAADVAGLVAALPGAEPPQVVDDRVIGRVAHGGAALVELVRGLDRAGIAVSGVESRRPSLDDVFLQLTGRSLRDAESATAAAVAPEEVTV